MEAATVRERLLRMFLRPLLRSGLGKCLTAHELLGRTYETMYISISEMYSGAYRTQINRSVRFRSAHLTAMIPQSLHDGCVGEAIGEVS